MEKSEGYQNKHDPCPVRGIFEMTEFIPVGWNIKKKISNIQPNHGPVKYVLYEKEIISEQTIEGTNQ